MTSLALWHPLVSRKPIAFRNFNDISIRYHPSRNSGWSFSIILHSNLEIMGFTASQAALRSQSCFQFLEKGCKEELVKSANFTPQGDDMFKTRFWNTIPIPCMSHLWQIFSLFKKKEVQDKPWWLFQWKPASNLFDLNDWRRFLGEQVDMMEMSHAGRWDRLQNGWF